MRRVVAALIVAALVLAAFGVTRPGSRGPSSLADIDVAGEAGEKPVIAIDAPFTVDKSGRRVLTEGTGEELGAGARIRIDYVGINGNDGEEFDTSYGSTPAGLRLDEDQVIPGLVRGLVGLRVGSRALLAIAPSDGYGPQGGIGESGIGADDTVVFFVEVLEVRHPLAAATGTPVEAVAGLPVVTVDAAGKPTVTIPQAGAPDRLVVQPLVEGGGEEIAAGQTVTLHYTGALWPGGGEFDSSWDRGEPEDVQLGAGAVIEGWDEGLVGRRIGSRVLLIVPPAKGYGAEGNTEAGIAGTDTLVFVVDLLGIN